MTLYNLYCDRCDERTTHESLHREPEAPDEVLATQHPRNERWVLCRECDAGRSKADIPEDGVQFYVKATVKSGLSIEVYPEMIEDGESLDEYLEGILKERRGEIAREIADGIRENQIEMSGFPESEELSGFPPNY